MGEEPWLREPGHPGADKINLVIDTRVQDVAGGFTTDDRRKIPERLEHGGSHIPLATLDL